VRRIAKIVLLAIAIWITSFYTYTGLVIASKVSYNTNKHIDTNNNSNIDKADYWNPNPYFILSEGKWGIRVWKWREFLACGYQGLDANSNTTYVNWDRDGLIEISLLSPFDLDWVYVAGLSMGSVWPNVKPVYQPEPLDVGRLKSLMLETRISNLKGVALSPLILPSWYAVLTDLWFEVKDVTIDGKHYDKKILGIDVFYSTMTGRLNIAMGSSNEYSRVEPCDKNFVYSIMLDASNYDNDKGVYRVDVIKLLERAREEAIKKGWVFDLNNVRLVMAENIVEAYFAYVYVNIEYSGIKYTK
jgi:hypothetical protein